MSIDPKIILLVLVLESALTGCKTASSDPPKSSAKSLTAFTLATSPVVTGVIDESALTVSATVPFGTTVSALIPTITHSGDSISPASGTAQNFGTPVVYTVTAADGSTQKYTVTVNVKPDAVWIYNPASNGIPGSWALQSGTAAGFPATLVLAAPCDLSRVTNILYPGQYRSNDYKAHGGFRFANNTNDSVTVTAPYPAQIYRASRYIEAGETQYLFDFINGMGLMYRLDHLLTLSARFQAIANTLPPATASSATTFLPSGQYVTTGETIATGVGFKLTGNTGFDWGVYDLRQKNKASLNAAWLAAHDNEQAPYALFWLNLLSTSDSSLVNSLPPGSTAEGKTSDYYP